MTAPAGRAEDAYSYCTVRALDLADRDVTIRTTWRSRADSTHGGLVYRGRVLYVNPTELGWAVRTRWSARAMRGGTACRLAPRVVNVRQGTDTR